VGPEFIAAHHIGSTAIPTIVAKPIVDVLLEIQSIARFDLLVESMRGHGYQAMGEYGLPGRRYFRKHTQAGIRSHHVHAYEAGNPEIRRHLAFRDFLLAHPEIAAEYSALKQRLALAHPNDMAAYVDGKDPFIRDVEAKALAWSRPA
jgi:GrpB-like predicted nucleotidyltransferase (UPF0157 family)